MKQARDHIRNFLQFTALQFIDHPDQAQLRISEGHKNKIRFRLILSQEDVAILIGRNGFTASAIRNVLKATAEKYKINASLQIFSHEEEIQRIAVAESKEIKDE